MDHLACMEARRLHFDSDEPPQTTDETVAGSPARTLRMGSHERCLLLPRATSVCLSRFLTGTISLLLESQPYSNSGVLSIPRRQRDGLDYYRVLAELTL